VEGGETNHDDDLLQPFFLFVRNPKVLILRLLNIRLAIHIPNPQIPSIVPLIHRGIDIDNRGTIPLWNDLGMSPTIGIIVIIHLLKIMYHLIFPILLCKFHKEPLPIFIRYRCK